jgi:hypothetical protein
VDLFKHDYDQATPANSPVSEQPPESRPCLFKKALAKAFVLGSLLPISMVSNLGAQEEQRPRHWAFTLRYLEEQSTFAKLRHLSMPHSVSEHRLPLTMERPRRARWSWAAAASSISAFYGKSEWSQCKLASIEREKQCCGFFPKASCNQVLSLDRALRRTGTYDETRSCGGDSPCGILDFEAIADEIKQGRPVGVRIAWRGGGEHYVVIDGYLRDWTGDYLYVNDPVYGRSPPLAVKDFRSSYQFIGDWTRTYLTRPEAALNVTPSLHAEPWSRSVTESTIIKQQEKGPALQLTFRDPNFLALGQKMLPFERLPFLGRDDVLSRPASDDKFDLAVPHPLYVFELNQLASANDPLLAKPAGSRILEMRDGKVFAAYDLTEGEELTIAGWRSSAWLLEALENALTEAARMSQFAHEIAELRLLTVPALSFEAIWLHYLDPASDVFFPMLDEGIPINRPIQPKELWAALRVAAQRRTAAEAADATHAIPKQP